jgi:hypothetical protein
MKRKIITFFPKQQPLLWRMMMTMQTTPPHSAGRTNCFLSSSFSSSTSSSRSRRDDHHYHHPATTTGKRRRTLRSRRRTKSNDDNNNNKADEEEDEEEKEEELKKTRRAMMTKMVLSLSSSGVGVLLATKTEEANALQLAPLGKPTRIGNEKRTDASIEEIKEILRRDLQPVEKNADGTFRGAYFVTGNVTPEIFEDDCRFIDPTNTTKSLSKYVNALKILFDPENSSVDLRSIEVKDENTIVGIYDCEGYLKLPWHPRVKPYTGTVTWKTSKNGLIESQTQEWSGVSAAGAIMESFTPS